MAHDATEAQAGTQITRAARGESAESDGRRFGSLEHSSLAVTTTYLRRLQGKEDRGWRSVAAMIDSQASPTGSGSVADYEEGPVSVLRDADPVANVAPEILPTRDVVL